MLPTPKVCMVPWWPGHGLWGPRGAGVQGTAAVQPCRGREPLLLNLHCMLKVNGDISLGVLGSLELL